MRLVTYTIASQPAARLAVRVGHRVLDVEAASRVDGEPLPRTLEGLLREGRGAVSRVQALAKAAQSSPGRFSGAMHEERAIRFLPPVSEAGTWLDVRTPAGRDPQPTTRRHDEFQGHNAMLALAGSGPFACMPAPVFVVGRTTRAVAPEDALDRIAGITLQLEVADAGGTRAAPSLMGPELVTLDEIADPDDFWMSIAVNGEERLRVSTHALPWKLPEALAHASGQATLEAGDVLALGFAPGEAASGIALRRGDIVECSIDGVTTLRATIASAA